MHEIKDTRRARVRIGYDGRVHKYYLGPQALDRYTNEVRVLKYLESKKCNFVPKLLEEHPDQLYIVTTNCGAVVSKMSKEKEQAIFDKLVELGIQHGDAFARNITYNPHQGHFCVIDFEFATILETGEGLSIKDIKKAYDTGIKDDQ